MKRRYNKRRDSNDTVLCTEGLPIMIWKYIHGNIVKMRCCDRHLEHHKRNDHGCSPLTTCRECDQNMVRHPLRSNIRPNGEA